MLDDLRHLDLSHQEQIEKRLCEESLEFFMSVFWKEIDGNPYKTGWHIQAICEHLEAVNRGEIRNLLINGPPRSCKSMPVSVFFQPWDWIKTPQRSWLTGANTQRLAVGFNYASRMIIRSEKYQRYWGDNFHMSTDNDLKTQFSNNCGGIRLACGAKTKLIGSGGERKVLDDPHMPGDSPKLKEEMGDWFFGTWRSRTNNPASSAEIVVMQCLDVFDLTAQIKEREKDLWEFLIFPSRFNPKRRYFTCLGWTDPRVEEGELLWPEHVDDRAEKILRASLREKADAQMDQDPQNVSDTLYKKENFNFFDKLIIDHTCDICISTTDTGIKSTESADFSASTIIIKKGMRKFHIDGFAKKVEINELIDEYDKLLSRWLNRGLKLFRNIIEDSANGPALAGISSRKFERIELIPTVGTNKLTRLKAVVPEFTDNNVWFPSARAVIVIDGVEYSLAECQEWLHEWLKQLRRVPGGGEKDDCPDATAQGLKYLEPLTPDDLDFDDGDDASAYIFLPKG